MELVHAYWTGALRRLQAEVDGLAKLVEHAGEQGRENELALSRMLSSLIPKRFGTGSGLLIDSKDSQSPQIDVVVYEQVMETALFAQTTQLLFPVEACYAAIEVKTTLRATDLTQFAASAGRVNALSPLKTHADGSAHPLKCLFAYSGWARPDKILEHILKLEDDQRPDLFYIVKLGLVGGRKDILRLPFTPPVDAEYVAGLTCRLAVGPDDEPERSEAGEWMFDMGTDAKPLVVDGVNYPQLRVAPRSYVYIDAARGLLVFLECLIRALQNKVGGEESVLTLYFTEQMSAVRRVTSP